MTLEKFHPLRLDPRCPRIGIAPRQRMHRKRLVEWKHRAPALFDRRKRTGRDEHERSVLHSADGAARRPAPRRVPGVRARRIAAADRRPRVRCETRRRQSGVAAPRMLRGRSAWCCHRRARMCKPATVATAPGRASPRAAALRLAPCRRRHRSSRGRDPRPPARRTRASRGRDPRRCGAAAAGRIARARAPRRCVPRPAAAAPRATRAPGCRDRPAAHCETPPTPPGPGRDPSGCRRGAGGRPSAAAIATVARRYARAAPPCGAWRCPVRRRHCRAGRAHGRPGRPRAERVRRAWVRAAPRLRRGFSASISSDAYWSTASRGRWLLRSAASRVGPDKVRST